MAWFRTDLIDRFSCFSEFFLKIFTGTNYNAQVHELLSRYSIPALQTIIYNRVDHARIFFNANSVVQGGNDKAVEEISLLAKEIIQLLKS